MFFMGFTVNTQGLQVHHICRVTELNMEIAMKSHLAPESLSQQGAVPPPLDLPKRCVPEARKVLAHIQRPPPCDSRLPVPVPPATTFLSAAAPPRAGCLPSILDTSPGPSPSLGWLDSLCLQSLLHLRLRDLPKPQRVPLSSRNNENIYLTGLHED